MSETPHLFNRILWAKANLAPFQSQYCIAWEDPDDPDAPMRVTTPAPEWMAMALHGGLLPPIEAYLADKAVTDEYERVHGSQEGFNWKDHGGAKHPYAEPIGPMTEEEAMEYLALKDLPTRVIEYKGNRQIIKFVPRHLIPVNRKWRNTWKLSQEAA